MAKKTKTPADVTAAEIATPVTSVIDVSPDAVSYDDKFNGRFAPVKREDIFARAWDMFKGGQLQPVEVAETGPGSYQLIYGFTRLKAAIAIRNGFPGPDGKTYSKPDFKLRAAVVTCKDDKTALLRNIRENTQRTDNSPMDHAKNIARLIEMGVKGVAIAALYGKDSAWVTRHNAYNKLPAKTQEMLHNGDISPAVANAMLAKDGLTTSQIEHLTDKVGKDLKVETVNEFIRQQSATAPATPAVTQTAPAADKTAAPAANDTATGKVIPRPLPAVKRLLTRFLAPGDETHPAIQTVFACILAYADGLKSEAEVDKIIQEIEKALPQPAKK